MAVAVTPECSAQMRAIRAARPIVSIEERFWAKVEFEPMSGCWIFVGAWTSAGYGALGLGTRQDGNVYAHRFAYELLRGPIAEGLTIDHLCRLPPCVNPWHHEVVTMRVNWLRSHHRCAITYRTGVCFRGHDMADAYGSAAKRQCRMCVREGDAARKAASR